MRIARRSVAVAVVVGVTAFAACVTKVQLSSTEDKTIVLNGTSPYDFGTHPLLSMSNFVSFELTSQMPTDDDIIMSVTQSSACNQFILMGPPPLGSAGTFEVNCIGPAMNFGSMTTGNCMPHNYMFAAAFHPTQQGTSTCDVTFNYMPKAGGSLAFINVRLIGTGQAPSLGMTVDPPTLPMGDVQVGSSASFPIHVENTGTVQLNLDVTEANDTNGYLAVNPTSTFLTAGSGMDFMASCTPTSQGSFLADYTFTGTNGGSNVTGMSHVTCNGVTSMLSITSPVMFDDTYVGVAPPQKTVTLTNNGGAGVAINSYALDSTAMTNGVSLGMATPTTPPLTLGPGSTATVALKYAASAPHSGSLGQLTVMTSGGNRTVTIFGNALPGDVATNPPSLEFGTVCAGVPKTLPVEIYASDVADVSVVGLVTPGPPYMSNPPVLPGQQTLRGNHANSFTVMITANTGSAGDYPAMLGFRTNLPGAKGMVDVPIHATSLSGGIAPDIDMVHFGSLAVGHVSGGKDVVFTNCGATPLDVTGAHIEGMAAGDFTIIKPENPATTIPSGGQEMFTLVMNPQGTGSRTGTLVIEFSGGPATVQLDGTGFDNIGPGSGDVDRETYYACSTTTDARGLAPVALALAAVLGLRRRRRGV